MNRRSANTRQAGYKPPQELPLRIYEVAKELNPELDIRTGIQRADWDFSKVPDELLPHCVLHEYARESITWHRWVREAKLRGNDPNHAERTYMARKKLRCNFSVQELHRPAVERLNPMAERAKQVRDRKQFKKLLGFQSIEQPKGKVGGRDSESSQTGSPLGLDASQFLAKYRSIRTYVDLVLRHECSPSPGAHPYMIEVNWDECDEVTLKKLFADWLRHYRPPHWVRSFERGHSPLDLRSNLYWLAGLRLMSVMPFDEAMNRIEKAGFDPQKVSLCSNKAGWQQKRNLASKKLRRLFPLLPRGEKPLSFASYESRAH